MKIQIYADGCNKKSIKNYLKTPLIKGFTTNPSILKNANVKSYKSFALELLKIVKKKPISFEVTADNFYDIYKQAKIISSWGKNVYVKIPIVNSKGESKNSIMKKLN
jgi:transaldolase